MCHQYQLSFPILSSVILLLPSGYSIRSFIPVLITMSRLFVTLLIFASFAIFAAATFSC
ncbi:hypothetical protein F5879DRAFT_929651 [Lentinula edodes]|nr:hypothetical protein F5879DRAFT_929651 [Lentinula edodes]